MRRSKDLSGLTSVNGVGDINVVGQRDVLDLNAGLLALFFVVGCPQPPHPAPRRPINLDSWVVTYPRFGIHYPSFLSSFFNASNASLSSFPVPLYCLSIPLDSAIHGLTAYEVLTYSW